MVKGHYIQDYPENFRGDIPRRQEQQPRISSGRKSRAA